MILVSGRRHQGCVLASLGRLACSQCAWQEPGIVECASRDGLCPRGEVGLQLSDAAHREKRQRVGSSRQGQRRFAPQGRQWTARQGAGCWLRARRRLTVMIMDQYITVSCELVRCWRCGQARGQGSARRGFPSR
jgi:hypothetical protein